MASAAVLRVKRKRGGPVPAGALLLACKRPRPDPEAAAEAAGRGAVERNLFRLAATVASPDEPVQKYVQEAITKDKAAQSLRPSLGSTQRVIQGLRASKQATRQESRYRLIASHRPDFAENGENVLDAKGAESKEKDILVSGKEKDTSQKGSHESLDYCGEFQLLDIVQEDVEKDTDMPSTCLQKSDDPDIILCNAVEMIRERLTVTDSNKEAEHSAKEDGYVYDIYYMEAGSPGWIENILSVQPYMQDCELVDEDCISEEIYEDEDDENNENNWRNDYPDEEDFLPQEDDESENSCYSDEDSGYIRRTWDKYQSDVLREFDYDGFQELDSE